MRIRYRSKVLVVAFFLSTSSALFAQPITYTDDVTIEGELRVTETDGSARLVIENMNPNPMNPPVPSAQNLVTLRNHGSIEVIFEDTGGGTTWAFKKTSSDGFSISQLGTGGSEFFIEQGGGIQLGAGGSKIVNIRPDGRVLFSDAGNVGIGVNAPSEALEIDGNLKLSGNIVSDGNLCLGTGCPANP